MIRMVIILIIHISNEMIFNFILLIFSLHQSYNSPEYNTVLVHEFIHFIKKVKKNWLVYKPLLHLTVYNSE
jgi:hypothetical protein